MFTVSVDGINVVNGKAAGVSSIGYVLSGYSSYEIVGFRTSNEEVHPFKFNDKQKSYAAKSDETQGDVSNCGVIGVQVYEEKEKPAPIVQHIYHYKEYVQQPTPIYSSPTTTIWNSSLIFGNNSETPTASYTANTVNASVRARSIGEQSMKASFADSACRSSNMYASYVKQEVDGGTSTSDWSAGTEFSKESVVDRVTNTHFDTGVLLVTLEIFYDYREGLLEKGVPIQKEVKIAAPQAFPSRFCKPPRDNF